MFRALRLRSAHTRFFENCRNLKEGRAFGSGAGKLLQALCPIPLLGLHEAGRPIHDALQWLEANCRKQPLTSEVLRHYHRLLGFDGSTRRHELRMGPDNPLRPPSPGKLPGLLAALDARMAQNDAAGRDAEAALRSAVELHHRIGTLHPFIDGNGRVARLAMNHQLRRFGHAYVIYPPLSESERFWNVLLGAGRGDFEPLVSFARTCRFRI